MAPSDIETPVTAEPPLTSAPSADASDWLKDLEAQQEEPSAAPEEPAASFTTTSMESIDWSFDQPEKSPDAVEPFEAVEPTETPEIPDWLKNVEASEPDMAPSSAEAELPDWLKPVAEETTPAAAEPEPFIEEFPPLITPVEPLTAPPSLESLGTSAKEQDDAMAWLESLAAKHGAKAEELVTDPNARSDKPPEWVEQAKALGEAQPIIPEPAPQEPVFLEPEPEQPFEPVESPSYAEPIMPGLEGSLQFEGGDTIPMIVPEPETPEEPAVEPVEMQMPESPSGARTRSRGPANRTGALRTHLRCDGHLAAQPG